MTHLENIPHILKCGITHSASKNFNPNYVPIGDSSLISARNNFLLNNGKRLGDYIPFYFGVRTPMLYVVQNGFNMAVPISAKNIVYCVTSIEKIIEQNLDFVFTDGHSVDGFTTQYDIRHIDNIENLIDWEAVNAKYWVSDTDLDLKRRKEAEFLVLGDIIRDAILGFIVFNESTKDKLIAFGIHATNIVIKPDFFFKL